MNNLLILHAPAVLLGSLFAIGLLDLCVDAWAWTIETEIPPPQQWALIWRRVLANLPFLPLTYTRGLPYARYGFWMFLAWGFPSIKPWYHRIILQQHATRLLRHAARHGWDSTAAIAPHQAKALAWLLPQASLLRARYGHEYIAVDHQTILDHDPDPMILYSRVRKTLGRRPHYLGPIPTPRSR